jgi:hypothetical protein
VRPHIFLDADGVLAHFDALAESHLGMHPRAYEDLYGSDAFWDQLTAAPSFFADLPLMPDAMELYEGVKHLGPSILTGCSPKYPWIRPQKAAWTSRHFPDAAVTMCRSKDKARFCKPGDVLIDDWTRYRTNWEHAGGIFIHHTSAKSSLLELRLQYPELFEQVPA